LIYIPDIKKRINELAPGWHEGTLNASELSEFYSLLDNVVVEARETRSDHVPEDERPEVFLADLLEHRFENVVSTFFNRYKQYLVEAKNQASTLEIEFRKTSPFLEWLGYAKTIAQTIILGDATTRRTRRNQIKAYLDQYDPARISKEEFIADRHLYANNKRLSSQKRELLRQKDEQREVDWNYLPWAEQCALNEGKGYDPGYKKRRLEDLNTRLEEAKALIERWEAGEFECFKTRTELETYIRTNLVGFSPEEIETLKQKTPNLINYLFGTKAQKGKLFWCLAELRRFETRSRKDEKNQDCDALERILDKQAFQGWSENERNNSDAIPANEEYCISEEAVTRFKEVGLTKKKIPIAAMRFVDGKSVPDIAINLGISERAVYKHLAKIKQNPRLSKLIKK